MNRIKDSSQGYVNVQDMAEYLAIKPSTLYALVEQKEDASIFASAGR